MQERSRILWLLPSIFALGFGIHVHSNSGAHAEEHQPQSVLILLDCSSSMKQVFSNKESRMEVAKRLVARFATELPPSINLGLRVFGYGKSDDRFMDCRYSALLIPLGQGNRRSLIEKIRNISANGQSPIAFALTQALENDLSGITGRRTVVLICDGGDSCEEDAPAIVQKVRNAHKDVTYKVVSLVPKGYAFDLKAVQAVADAAGGEVYSPESISELIKYIAPPR
ncbi:MAG: VWA domain-containing protein [Candidatus Obscuribacterales bacterium]|nr:VWA domain-containing protein [Candidatus Obscuribacterales bacterium]